MSEHESGWHGDVTELQRERLKEFERAVGLLQRELSERIAREEGTGGFFAFLCTASPRYLSFIPTLKAEHLRLLNTVAALRAKITRARSDHYTELIAEARAIMAAIEDHEELERDVLIDALESPYP